MEDAKSVLLLSGGLDSFVILGAFKSKYNIDLALTFDYGQKSSVEEIYAANKMREYYNIRHEVISLDWLREITHSSLVSDDNVPTENLGTNNSAKCVWVPNRNGLFINIAACYADSYDYKYILFGANKDEGETFPDNTEKFRYDITQTLKNSTLKKPEVLAPLINYSKNDIVKLAVENNVPLEMVYSCYNSGKIHCGKCESCRHLKNALIDNKAYKYVELLFGE